MWDAEDIRNGKVLPQTDIDPPEIGIYDTCDKCGNTEELTEITINGKTMYLCEECELEELGE